VKDLRDLLADFAEHLRRTWTGEFDPLYRDIDVELWGPVHHNPQAFLATVADERIGAHHVHDPCVGHLRARPLPARPLDSRQVSPDLPRCSGPNDRAEGEAIAFAEPAIPT